MICDAHEICQPNLNHSLDGRTRHLTSLHKLNKSLCEYLNFPRQNSLVFPVGNKKLNQKNPPSKVIRRSSTLYACKMMRSNRHHSIEKRKSKIYVVEMKPKNRRAERCAAVVEEEKFAMIEILFKLIKFVSLLNTLSRAKKVSFLISEFFIVNKQADKKNESEIFLLPSTNFLPTLRVLLILSHRPPASVRLCAAERSRNRKQSR